VRAAGARRSICLRLKGAVWLEPAAAKKLVGTVMAPMDINYSAGAWGAEGRVSF